MTITRSKLVPLALAVAVLAPTAAPAAIHNPRSDAAMRKAVRDFAKYGLNGKVGKASAIKVDCVQAAEIGSIRPCSGTFSVTLAGRTARYTLTSKSNTFRISPGAMEANLHAKAMSKVPGLKSVANWGAILQ